MSEASGICSNGICLNLELEDYARALISPLTCLHFSRFVFPTYLTDTAAVLLLVFVLWLHCLLSLPPRLLDLLNFVYNFFLDFLCGFSFIFDILKMKLNCGISYHNLKKLYPPFCNMTIYRSYIGITIKISRLYSLRRKNIDAEIFSKSPLINL